MQLFECGTLVDGSTDGPVENAGIVVDDGTIQDVGPMDEIAAHPDADHIDYTENVVVPGLLDVHAHLHGCHSMDVQNKWLEDPARGAARATMDLRKLLRNGFTSVRDCGSKPALGLKEAVNKGTIPGPRIYACGAAISQTGGHGDMHSLPYEWISQSQGFSTLADGVPECRKEARKQIREGADFLKIMTTGGVSSQVDAPELSQYSDEEIAAMTEEAHRFDLPIASHAQGAAGIKSALKNGVDTIEHGIYLDDEAIEMFLETGATLVSTLAIVDRIVTEGPVHDIPEHAIEDARVVRESHIESLQKAYQAGVPIALGTDFSGPDLAPHGENVMEAELLVEKVGFDEIDAIRAGTSIAARAVPEDRIGSISPGNYADLVVLEEDPLEDISALRAIETVYKGGEPVAV